MSSRADGPFRLSARAYPPTGRIVGTQTGPVHLFEEGDPSRPAVVLLHGASGNSRDFSFSLTTRLADRFRAIAIDRPGHGHSSPLPNGGESPFDQATALDTVLNAIGVERAIVVGHSYGGAVAMAWALSAPSRVAGVVSLAGATMPWPGGLGPWYRWASSTLGGATLVPLVSAFATRRAATRTVAAIFAPQSPPDGYLAYVGVGLSLQPASLRVNARQVNALKPYVTEMAQRYRDLQCPVEVVHGSEDTTVPIGTHGARMVPLIPGARLTTLSGVGHMPHHVDPDTAVAVIGRVAAAAGLC